MCSIELKKKKAVKVYIKTTMKPSIQLNWRKTNYGNIKIKEAN